MTEENVNKKVKKLRVWLIDSEPTESGVISNEISNNECTLCFGWYKEDLSVTGKLDREWVQCTNWGEPERAPHWSVVEVYVGASRCAWSVNKTI